MKPGVYIVGTPIGNLDDISARALDTLRLANCILAEDTRHTLKLLNRHQIRNRLISCHKFNEASRIPMVIEKVRAGAAVALVTNAGMPGISDPGARLAAACRKQGVYLTVIPGPSAVTAAVALNGFTGSGFLCAGFLPRKPAARQQRLAELARADLPVVVFEAPQRCLRLLEEIQAIFGAREIFMARELTKLNEELRWGTAGELARLFGRGPAAATPPRAPRGEVTLVIAPAAEPASSDTEPDEPPFPSAQGAKGPPTSAAKWPLAPLRGDVVAPLPRRPSGQGATLPQTWRGDVAAANDAVSSDGNTG